MNPAARALLADMTIVRRQLLVAWAVLAGCGAAAPAVPLQARASEPIRAAPDEWRGEATDGTHVCGLRGPLAAGVVWCRDEISGSGEPPPPPVALAIHDAIRVAMSQEALCVLRAGLWTQGHVWCGSVGLGYEPVSADVAFRDLGRSPDPIDLVMFADAICVRDRAQTVWCRDVNSPATFSVVPGLVGARALALGTLVPAEYESPVVVLGCAVTARGGVSCFLAPSSTATEVPGFADVTALMIARDDPGRVCARTQRGPLRCVKLNEDGVPDGPPVPLSPGEAEAWGDVGPAMVTAAPQ